MTPFAAKLASGETFLGLGLSDQDLMRLKAGEPVVVSLESVGVGHWVKEADGSRNFIQPRESKIVLIAGDSREEIGEFLHVELP